jgi:(2R)-ethylmalonyl-CoA mutase
MKKSPAREAPSADRAADEPRARRPWIMRTYSGHSTPEASNALYRRNLAKGQTGLSVAFDLPTQTGYDPDHPLAAGEVGKVGVPVAHLGDMRALFEGIPIEKMNTSMTINATAPWLLALYVALAAERNVDLKLLSGTTQNDILKEYLSRGTFIFPPRHSLRLASDLIAYTVETIPEWNPINICSYHLQEAGATTVQELAYALTTAICVLDTVKERLGAHAEEVMPRVAGRISFFVNAGVRFIEEMCKLRAFVALWDRLLVERYGVADEKLRRFRYGVQVNSLGLTAAQPENNVVRIVLEMLGVVLSKNARARAVQLPAWNEALGLPRAWDQQWSIRAQQIMAYETDVLEYDDIFDGSPVIEAKVKGLMDEAWREVEGVLASGGPLAAVESGYIKERLVASNAARLERIEQKEQIVVGVNQFVETELSPLTAGGMEAILTVDPKVERAAIERLEAWKRQRDAAKVSAAIGALERAAKEGANIVPASIEAARAGVTTGEWGGVLRQVFGEYRAPTGIGAAASVEHGGNGGHDDVEAIREEVRALGALLGRAAKILVGKPGLDGHSNGAEQIALKARDVGFEVVYEGIRVTPAQIVASAIEEGVHLVGLSILSGSHLELVPAIVNGLRAAGAKDLPVVLGGIIPDADAERLTRAGVARVYTPKDFELNAIMRDLARIIRVSHGPAPA